MPGDRLTLCLGPPTRRPALGDTIALRHFLIYRRVSPADNAQFLHAAYRDPTLYQNLTIFESTSFAFVSLGKKSIVLKEEYILSSFMSISSIQQFLKTLFSSKLFTVRLEIPRNLLRFGKYFELKQSVVGGYLSQQKYAIKMERAL